MSLSYLPASVRRLGLWLTVLLLVLPTSIIANPNGDATPSADSDERLYVGHGARLTARMPADWVPDGSLDYDYVGSDGFISSTAVTMNTPPNPTVVSLADACNLVASRKPFADEASRLMTSWRGMSACLIRSTVNGPLSPVSLVFSHPENTTPAMHVAVTVNADHFDAVTATISFEPAIVTATNYLEAAIDLIQMHSLQRDELDWDAIRTSARGRMVSVSRSAAFTEAHKILVDIIAKIQIVGGDGHTYFLPASVAASLTESIPPTTTPSRCFTDGSITCISIPPFMGSGEEGAAYAAQVHHIIASGRAGETCGHIIDLRNNTGGNMYPMLYGIAPLLQPGVVIGFRTVTGSETEVAFLDNGTFTYDGNPIEWMPSEPVLSDPRLSTLPLAVLIGHNTGSSGEAIALVLAARTESHLFGSTTADFATAPTQFRLFDGSILSVATTWQTDPNGRTYPDGISPDVEVPSYDAVDVATAWIEQHPTCLSHR